MATDVYSCLLNFEVSLPSSIAVQIALARRPGLDISERLEVLNNAVPVTAGELAGPDGGRQHLIQAQPGTLAVAYEATATRTAMVAAPPATDEQRVAALRPSRYCPSDRMVGFARSHFGDVPAVADRVRAICDYVWQHIRYEAVINWSTMDAIETLLDGRGVCRDFAHLVVALCRAVDVPARVAAVYAPGLFPMDFHLVAETVIDGYWYAWDATRTAPRSTLARIGTGRDAADVALSTVLAGGATLASLQITAIAADDLPLDDHEALVALG